MKFSIRISCDIIKIMSYLRDISEKDILSATDMNLYDFVKSGTGYDDDDTVFSYFGKSISFGDFRAEFDRLVRVLASDKELHKGDRIIISLLTMPESIALLYACNYVGLVPVMADIRLSPKEMKKIITDTGASLAFVTDVNAAKLSIVCEAECLRKIYVVSVVECFGYPPKFFKKFSSFFTGNRYMFEALGCKKIKGWKDFTGKQIPKLPEGFTPSDGNSEIIFATSGTTGEKKYVRHAAKTLNRNVYFNEYFFDFASPEYSSVVTFMPIFVCLGFAGSVHLPLFYGMKLHIHMTYDLRKIPEIIMQVGPNIFIGSIGYWERVISSKYAQNGDMSFLRFALVSGEKCERERLLEINDFLEKRGSKTKLLPAYGMTELTVISMVRPGEYNPDSVGKPFPGVNVSIVEPGTEKILTPNETGEICVDSPCMTLGYFGNEEGTKALIKKHSDGKEWVHTGDLGYLDKEGYLYIVDRLKNMHVSVSGTKVFLSTIDSAVMKCEGVESCAAVSVKHDDRRDIKGIILYVKAKDGRNTGKLRKTVNNICLTEIPTYLIPDRVVFLNEMPMTASGKVDKHELEKMAEDIHLNMGISLVTLK